MSHEEHTLVTDDNGVTTWDDGVAYDTAKPFRCHWAGCEKSFSRLTYVQRHAKLVHEGIRDHVCSCGQGFGRSDVLAVHRKSCKDARKSPSDDDDVPVGRAPKRARAQPARKPAAPKASGSGSSASSAAPRAFVLRYACSNCAAHGYACDGLNTCQTCTALGVVCLPNSDRAASRPASASSQHASPPELPSAPGYFDPPRQSASPIPVFAQPQAPPAYQPAPMSATLAPLMSPTLGGILGMYPPQAQSTPSPPLADQVPALEQPGSNTASTEGPDSPPVPFNDAELAMQLMPLTPSALLDPNTDLSAYPFPAALTDLLVADRIMSPSPLEYMDPSIYNASAYLADKIDPSVPFATDPHRLVGASEYYRLSTGYQLPKASRLAEWANFASQTLLDSLPILHLPTFDSSKDQSVNFGISLMGAAALRHRIAASHASSLMPPPEPNTDASQPGEFVDSMLARKRGYLVQDYARRYAGSVETPLSEADSKSLFQLMRSMLMFQLSGLGHDDPVQRATSYSYHKSLIEMARRYGLIRRASAANTVAPAGTASNDVRWRQWVEIETLRRMSWMLNLVDLAVAARGVSVDAIPLMCFDDMDQLPLPSPDMLWQAQDADTWAYFHAMVGTEIGGPMPMVKELMLPTGAPVSRVPLSNLAAAVLGRSLAFFLERVHVSDCDGLLLFGLRRNEPDRNRAIIRQAQDRLESLSCLERGPVAVDLLKSIRSGNEAWLGSLGASS